MNRRTLLRVLGSLPLVAPLAAAGERFGYAPVSPNRPLTLPADHAAHPDYAIEWWYVTGFLAADRSETPWTFQVTFFRSRPEPGPWLDNPSAFTPRQIINGHVALGNPAEQELRHWRRMARLGLDGGRADPHRLDVGIRDWGLQEEPDGSWRVALAGEPGNWELRLRSRRDPVRHGDGGISPKDEAGQVASYYYTYPTMEVTGTLAPDGRPREVRGQAWFDHEWTSTFLPEGTSGWDWVGLRFEDGSALMAYRFRDEVGEATFQAGTWIDPGGPSSHLEGEVLAWEPLRDWTSPESGRTYTVAWDLRVGDRRFRIRPFFDQQELVGRGRVRPTYWEGAVVVTGSLPGRGFLEMARFGAG